MIFLLYGKEEYLARKKLQEIWEAYGASGKTGFSAKRLEAGNLSLEELKNELQNQSLFQEKKLLVLEDVFGAKELKEHILRSVEVLAKNPSIILVLLERGKILMSDSLLKALSRYAGSPEGRQTLATVHEYKELDAAKLDQWIVKEGKALGVEIAKDARSLLMQEAGHDLWRLSQELAKLAASAFGGKQGQAIGRQDVAALIPEAALAGDIFVTLNAIAGKNKTKAFSLLHRHIAKGESPVYLLSMLHFQIRSLLEAKESNSGWKARDAANFSSEELKNMHRLLLQADVAMKTGQMEQEAALDAFLFSVFFSLRETSRREAGGEPSETFFEPRYSF